MKTTTQAPYGRLKSDFLDYGGKWNEKRVEIMTRLIAADMAREVEPGEAKVELEDLDGYQPPIRLEFVEKRVQAARRLADMILEEAGLDVDGDFEV